MLQLLGGNIFATRIFVEIFRDWSGASYDFVFIMIRYVHLSALCHCQPTNISLGHCDRHVWRGYIPSTVRHPYRSSHQHQSSDQREAILLPWHQQTRRFRRKNLVNDKKSPSKATVKTRLTKMYRSRLNYFSLMTENNILCIFVK